MISVHLRNSAPVWARMAVIITSLFIWQASNPARADGTVRSFTVTGGEGSVTFMGRQQPTPVDPGGTITLQATSDSTAILDVGPEIGARDIQMRREAGNLWLGSFNEWVGLPAEVAVRMSFDSPTIATLLLDGTSQLGQFRILMNLKAIDGSPGGSEVARNNETAKPENIPPVEPNPNTLEPADPPACVAYSALENQILPFSGPDEVQVIRAIGIIHEIIGLAANRTEANCKAAREDLLANPQLQDVLVQAGIVPSQSTPNKGPTGMALASCRRVDAIARAIDGTNDDEIVMIFDASMQSSGFPSLSTATNQDCLRLLELLTMEGLGSPEQVRQTALEFANQRGVQPTPAPVPSPRPSPSNMPSIAPTGGAACNALAQATRPILRGNNAGARSTVLRTLQANGVTDIAQAQRITCAAIMIELIAAAIIPDDGIDWTNQARTDAPVAPTQSATTVNLPGPPILPDPSDFVPETNQSPNAPAPNAPAARVGGCQALSDFIVAVLNSGNGRHVFELADVLNAAAITSITGTNDDVCTQAQTAAVQRGVQP